MKPLILGIGNILLSDEGVGVRVVQALEKRAEISPYVFEQFDIVDGGTCGMELLDTLANRDYIIVIDAVLAGKEPGEIVVLKDEQVPVFFSRKISPHQLGLCDVLSALKLTDEYPKNLCLIGIQPDSLAPRIGLTETMEKVMPAIFIRLNRILTEYGLPTLDN
ncbi:hydrogenase 2 maturation endopeptidase [Actinobacillus succinogenes]|uniref:Hydrogenase maturation protease n=1 Tax=Actinobacillus succinogenes (strain ATCC 55618 / DSM 22257 / CCUG 43843 / 130Z) TaxID=339671 RepID=A6VNU4_ACTSZ|nr:HyaD/HybD family hydrogenase maturation endopeptidase [Actinobacillus succinogenes]ABR74641.1 hydrogenase maturation protease [Actinobacillus succinogenes 130Z]PHI40935.1 hydrogenase 2 maturation endopeptidase [Actinobacillus succinogenes]